MANGDPIDSGWSRLAYYGSQTHTTHCEGLPHDVLQIFKRSYIHEYASGYQGEEEGKYDRSRKKSVQVELEQRCWP